MKKNSQMSFKMQQWKLWLVVSILVLMAVLSGCGEEKKEKPEEDMYKTLEEVDYEFLVFFEPSAQMLLQSFTENHPEINIVSREIKSVLMDIDLINQGLHLDAMIKQYGYPDLILVGPADENGGFEVYSSTGATIDRYDLPGCYEKGHYADLSMYSANDTTVDPDAYFPGTFDVFRDKDILYALPLSIHMDFMMTTDTKYSESAFSQLQEGYTGKELLEVMQMELDRKRDVDEFFCPERISAIRLLYQLGGVTQNETGIRVDEEIFKRVYEFTYLNNKQAAVKQAGWNENGRIFTAENGFVMFTAFEPRAYEGKFDVSFWASMDAPAVALTYATTANEYHVEDGTKAIYIPNYDNGSSYTASVGIYGAVGAESGEPELSYKLLRMLMDEEIMYFDIPDDILGFHGDSFNYCPVNKEQAAKLFENFENRNALMLYGHVGSGRYFQMLDIVKVGEEEKEKHAKMLDGITGMTYLNYDMMEAAHAIGEYQYMEVKDYKGCYEAVVKALNEAFNERNG